MAKKSYQLVRMQSTESAYYFVTKKAGKGVKASEKLAPMRKYDPVVKRHVQFEEKKMHSHSNK
ncbi:MAG: 50S ribosomal protein L33 [Candidatus Neomarinimicrobiota bacterium]